MLYGEINRQRMKIINEHVVADTIDYLEMKFLFRSDDWDGLEKWVHFAKDGEVYDIRLTDDCIRKEDHLNLSAGIWKVYLHGNEFSGGKVIERITTNAAILKVEPTGTLDGEPFPAMPASVTEQILARLEDVEQNGGGSGGGISRETDPTVPDWAKQPKKPTYTAEEVGAATKEQFNQLSKEIADKLDANKLPDAINTALAQAKESGEFDGKPGAPGNDYVLTEADKTEIAEQAAGLIDTALLTIIGSGVTA